LLVSSILGSKSLCQRQIDKHQTTCSCCLYLTQTFSLVPVFDTRHAHAAGTPSKC
jgi:hypothetical protein